MDSKSKRTLPQAIPKQVLAFFNQAYSAVTQQNIPQTKVVLAQAVVAYPDNLEAHIALASIVMISGDYLTAQKLLNKAIELAPEDPLLYNLLSVAYYETGQEQIAKQLLEKVLNMDPDNLIARSSLTEIDPKKSKSIEADENLSNIKSIALKRRSGNYQIGLHGLTIYCHDLLSFYFAAKDIFLHRIYNLETSKSSPVIIDGGGHIGLFTLFAKQKYPNSRITVFEPDDESWQLLNRNIQANGFKNVKVVKSGLYKHDGEISFASDHSDGSSIFTKGKPTSTIKVVRLSEYIETEIDLLKLNIEGAETDVIAEIEQKLPLIREIVIEYHGFPEVGQNLHNILSILDRAGFRYAIHDFDEETNPATKPPFRIEKGSRFFLLIYAKRLFPVKQQASVPTLSEVSNQTLPVSTLFGSDRGKPIDRYYIENFLDVNKSYIRGSVLEIGNSIYTRKYGSDVTQSDVLNYITSPNANIVGDLATGENIPLSAYDCIIMTQTIQFIFDVRSVLQHAFNALKPNGVLLLTASGISQISRYDMDRWGEYWRFTDKSLETLLSEIVPEESVHVDAYGNVAVAKAFLDGRALHEIPQQVLDYKDNNYQVILTTRVHKRAVNQVSFRKPLVLLYHRVADDPLDAQLLSVSPKNFEAHLKQLADNYNVLPLHTLLDDIRNGVINPKTVAITFDDGYLDNLTNAVPLLKKYGLHATIFITSGLVGSQEEFWWDALERIFLTCEPLPEFLNVDGFEGDSKWDMCSPKGRLKAYEAFCSLLRTLPVSGINKTIDSFFKWSGLKKQARLTHRIVNETDLMALSSSPLIEIGAHGVNHVVLGLMKAEEQTYEIRKSKRSLERITEQPVRLFSYPYGNISDFNEITKKILHKEGFDAGIANVQGRIEQPVDLYAIPRRLVRNWGGKQFKRWMLDANMNRLEKETLFNRMNKLIDYQYSLAYRTAE